MPRCNLNIEITLRHGCSPVNLLHIYRTPLPKNTRASEWRYTRSVIRTYVQLMIVDMTNMAAKVAQRKKHRYNFLLIQIA